MNLMFSKNLSLRIKKWMLRLKQETTNLFPIAPCLISGKHIKFANFFYSRLICANLKLTLSTCQHCKKNLETICVLQKQICCQVLILLSHHYIAISCCHVCQNIYLHVCLQNTFMCAGLICTIVYLPGLTWIWLYLYLLWFVVMQWLVHVMHIHLLSWALQFHLLHICKKLLVHFVNWTTSLILFVLMKHVTIWTMLNLWLDHFYVELALLIKKIK